MKPKTAEEIQEKDIKQLERYLGDWRKFIQSKRDNIQSLLLKKLGFMRTIQDSQQEIKSLESSMIDLEKEIDSATKEVNVITDKILTAYKEMV